MFAPDLVVRSRRVTTERGMRAAAIHIRSEKIVGVLDFDDVPTACPLDDVGDAVILPGVVDTHVHACGSDEADFAAVTRAAAAGGVTTIVDMPFPGPSVTSLSALEAKWQAADRRSHVDVGFWAGLLSTNVRELPRLFEAGALGFYCSLRDSSAAAFPAVSDADLRAAMPVLTRMGAALLVHAELAHAGAQRWPWRWRSYAAYLDRQPKTLENEAIASLVQWCRDFRTRTHIVHLSSSDALAPLFHARLARLPISAETCPHFLYFAAEDIRGTGAAFRWTPPIRGRENRELLWAAVVNGLIGPIVSGGRTPVGLSLAIMWTAAHMRGCTLEQLAKWMCRAPAELAGLTRKGRIDVGYDADLIVFGADAEFVVEPSAFRDCSAIPYAGQRLRGLVERTYLRGTLVYSRNRGWTSPNCRGKLIGRGTS